MPTTYKYPFKNTTELKEVVSEIFISITFEVFQSSFPLAMDNVIDVISQEVYDEMMVYYNSGSYPSSATEEDIRLTKLVDLVKIPFANFLLYHHFIWLTINIDGASVTTVKSDTRTTVFKYQSDEAKIKLLQTAHSTINTLFDFLNAEKAHFSSWTDSDQYKALEEIIFNGYKDFDVHFGIEKSALFYSKVLFYIVKIQREEIITRIDKEISDLTDETLKIKIKDAVAYRTMAKACLQLDYFNLPSSIKQTLDNEQTPKNNSPQKAFVRKSLSESFNNEADNLFKKLDMYIVDKNETDKEIDPYLELTHDPEIGDKFYSMT